jgi:hypothetical protein
VRRGGAAVGSEGWLGAPTAGPTGNSTGLVARPGLLPQLSSKQNKRNFAGNRRVGLRQQDPAGLLLWVAPPTPASDPAPSKQSLTVLSRLLLPGVPAADLTAQPPDGPDSVPPCSLEPIVEDLNEGGPGSRRATMQH